MCFILQSWILLEENCVKIIWCKNYVLGKIMLWWMQKPQKNNYNSLNQLTSMLHEITQDRGWPLFQFRRHYHLWPSSILKFCRSEWSAHWSLRYVQQRSEIWVKILQQNFCNLTLSYSMVNIAHGKKTFSENLWSQRSITAAKISEKEEKERWKTLTKPEKA